MVNFKELIGLLTIKKTEGDIDFVVSDFTDDSRQVKEGTVFIAVRGFSHDGHEYINKAIASGARAVIAEQDFDAPAGVAKVVAEDTKKPLPFLAALAYGKPSEKLKLIGITGTNGKTTTTNLIKKILDDAGQPCGLIGTIHTIIGNEIIPVNNTTPGAVELQKLLAKMLAAGMTHCVMEVSSHALDMDRVAGCQFATAGFTNLTQDHLDYHKTMEDYLKAKLKLFTGVLCTSDRHCPPGYAIVNIDDPYAQYFIDASKSSEIIKYGVSTRADAKAENITIEASGSVFTINYLQKCYELKIPTPGMFSVSNALAAFSTALALGILPEQAAASLSNSEPVKGRFESVPTGTDFAVIVDYAHTPDGLENILKTAQEFVKGRIITVFGCGGDRDRTKRPLMGAIAAKLSDYVIITSDNPRTEEPSSIIAEIETGLLRESANKSDDYMIIADRYQAISHAVSMAKAGDVIMIAGKGHENYQIVGTEKRHFDDKETVLEIIAKMEQRKRC